VVPENLRFGGGVSDTVFNPAVAVILILACLLMCLLGQRKIIVPFLLTSILIPSDQVLVIGGLHFPLLRILILFGMIRIFLIKGRGNWKVFSGGLNSVDKAVILLSLTSAVAGVLLFRNGQAFIFQLGNLYNALGAYFLVRCLIRDQDDVVRVIRVIAVIVVVLGAVTLFEQSTGGHNPYAWFGGARARYFASAMERGGRVRATASFGTPILAGVFGSVSFPLFVGLWIREKKERRIAILGMVGATVMVLASNSSTPLLAYLAGVMGFCLWRIRRIMGVIRWGIVVILICLHMVMKAPVWHLITRIDISGSSYHRYALLDACIRHFWDWWLIGTKSNADWGWDMWDTANQYVETAQNSGLLGLIIFLAMLVFGFRYLGQARRAATEKRQALFFWSLAVALFVHAVSFFGISYWDQSIVGWYVLLAFIGATAVAEKVTNAVPQPLSSLEFPTNSPRLQPANSRGLLQPWHTKG
jgi:hypothetical protein